MQDDIYGYKGLISAVITRAISDSLIQIKEKRKMSPITQDAFRFLLGDDVGLFLQFLEIDKDYFQKHFVESMFKDGEDVHFHTTKKRSFRINYKKYMQKENHSLIMTATYKG